MEKLIVTIPADTIRTDSFGIVSPCRELSIAITTEPAIRGPTEWSEVTKLLADDIAKKLIGPCEMKLASSVFDNTREYRSVKNSEWTPV